MFELKNVWKEKLCWLDDFSQLIKALWDKCTSLLQSLVLGYSRLRSLVGTSSCMAKLDLREGIGPGVVRNSLGFSSIVKMVLCCPPTSEENMVAQVPMHQHTTGFVILPRLIASQILYSSVPPICRTQTVMTVWGQSKAVVLIITHLSQDNNHLHSRSVLITQDMVSKHRAWVSK